MYYRIFSYLTSEFLEDKGKILEFRSRGEANRYLQNYLNNLNNKSKSVRSTNPYAIVRVMQSGD